VTDALRKLYAPIIPSITAPNFTYDGETFSLPGPPIFTKPLGKRVIILDADSRGLNSEGMWLSKNPSAWNKLKPASAGLMGHYLYAQLHGYDYRFIHAPDFDDRWGTWVKVTMVKEALKDYDFVVFMDSDAAFNNFELPLEWLLNYWNITKDVNVAMSFDPNEPQNFDSKGMRLVNTGFQIAQASPATQELYKAWAECPLEDRYEGCSRWKFDFAHEQSAFGEYLRYDFNKTNNIRGLPCREANGCPEAEGRGDSGCVGIFVRHYWQDKSLPHKYFAESFMRGIAPALHQQFINNHDQAIYDATDMAISGGDILY
jgi:hypothetical protein